MTHRKTRVEPRQTTAPEAREDSVRAHIVGEMPVGGHLRVELLDGPHAGSTWAMLRRHHRDGEFRVTYHPDDQFVAPA